MNIQEILKKAKEQIKKLLFRRERIRHSCVRPEVCVYREMLTQSDYSLLPLALGPRYSRRICWASRFLRSASPFLRLWPTILRDMGHISSTRS